MTGWSSWSRIVHRWFGGLVHRGIVHRCMGGFVHRATRTVASDSGQRWTLNAFRRSNADSLRLEAVPPLLFGTSADSRAGSILEPRHVICRAARISRGRARKSRKSRRMRPGAFYPRVRPIVCPIPRPAVRPVVRPVVGTGCRTGNSTNCRSGSLTDSRAGSSTGNPSRSLDDCRRSYWTDCSTGDPKEQSHQ
jgi:hypothetical protein